MEGAILLYILSKKKKFLDKNLRKLENIARRIINFQRIPKFHFHKSKEGSFERLGIHESNALDVKTISG